jgi:hypothetical protein
MWILVGILDRFMKKSTFALPFIAVSLAILTNCCRQYISSEEVIDAKFRDREENVAPLFRHGEGTTDHCACNIGTSCWPVFCDERRAIELIIEELGKAGIKIDRMNVRIEGVRNFRRQRYFMSFCERLGKCDRWILDGYCSEYNVGFEYISRGDCSDLGHEYLGWKWRRYNMIAASEELRELLDGYGKMTVGVFYDPLFPVALRAHKSDRECDRDYAMIDRYVAWQLQCQVQDFISWLRVEGYLEPENR